MPGRIYKRFPSSCATSNCVVSALEFGVPCALVGCFVFRWTVSGRWESIVANGTGNHGQAHGSRLAGNLSFWWLFSFGLAVVPGGVRFTKRKWKEFKNETLEPGGHGGFVEVQVPPQMSGIVFYIATCARNVASRWHSSLRFRLQLRRQLWVEELAHVGTKRWVCAEGLPMLINLYQCSTRVDRSTMSLLAWLWLWLRLGVRSSELIKVLQRREIVPRVACDPWINGLVAVNHVEAWVVWDEAPSLVIKIQVSDLRVGVCQCFWFLSPGHPRLYIRLQTDNRTNALFMYSVRYRFWMQPDF